MLILPITVETFLFTISLTCTDTRGELQRQSAGPTHSHVVVFCFRHPSELRGHSVVSNIVHRLPLSFVFHSQTVKSTPKASGTHNGTILKLGEFALPSQEEDIFNQNDVSVKYISNISNVPPRVLLQKHISTRQGATSQTL